VGVVRCGIGGLVVAHVGRRLLLDRTPRQFVVPWHNINVVYYESIKRELKDKMYI
jgi:hypothetical protein